MNRELSNGSLASWQLTTDKLPTSHRRVLSGQLPSGLAALLRIE